MDGSTATWFGFLTPPETTLWTEPRLNYFGRWCLMKPAQLRDVGDAHTSVEKENRSRMVVLHGEHKIVNPQL